VEGRWLGGSTNVDCGAAIGGLGEGFRGQGGAGVGAGDRVFFAFSFGPFIGFWAAYEGARTVGAMTIPAASVFGAADDGKGLSERALQLYEAGAAADARFGEVLSKQYPTSQIHSQFEIHTPYGRRFVDHAVEDGNGGHRLFEVKANGSRYTKVQRQKDTWIKNNLGWDTTVIRMSQSCPIGC